MTLIESALAPVLRELGERCTAEVGFSPAVGLIRLILHQRRDTLALGLAEIDTGSARARTRDAPVLSTFGYLAAVDGPGVHLTLDEWRQAREHLAGREAFPADRASFFFRPWHLYGVALGVDAAREADGGGAAWLAALLEAGLSHAREGSLEHRVAFNLAARCCGSGACVPIVEAVESCSTSDLALLIWAREVLPDDLCVLRGEAPEAVLLDRVLRDGVNARDAVAAAFTLVALDTILVRLRKLVAQGLSGAPVQQIQVSGQYVQFNQGGTGHQTN